MTPKSIFNPGQYSSLHRQLGLLRKHCSIDIQFVDNFVLFFLTSVYCVIILTSQLSFFESTCHAETFPFLFYLRNGFKLISLKYSGSTAQWNEVLIKMTMKTCIIINMKESWNTQGSRTKYFLKSGWLVTCEPKISVTKIGFLCMVLHWAHGFFI